MQVYVQDLLWKDGARVSTQILIEGAYVYICGETAMATQVEDTIIKIIRQYGKMNNDEAEMVFRNLKVSAQLISLNYLTYIFKTLLKFDYNLLRRKVVTRLTYLDKNIIINRRYKSQSTNSITKSKIILLHSGSVYIHNDLRKGYI